MNNFEYNLGQRFQTIVLENKNKIALSFIDNTFISYSELEILSNRIAHFLLSKKVQKGAVIAIFNDKTKETFATMLACIKIGVIYTNLDFNSPIERLKKMITICQPTFIFSPIKYNGIIEKCEYSSINIINYIPQIFDNYKSHFPSENQQVTGNMPAYIMFTSGSTGFPKGVVITHFNVLHFISWSKQTYNSNSEDIFTNINPMHFDNAVFDFYASLFIGASCIPIPEELTKHPRRLIDSITKLKPTIWFSVPSMLIYMLKLRALKVTDIPSLRIVTFGGEGFPKNQFRNLWEIWGNKVQFINVYGPTECTCICSSYNVSSIDLPSDELLPLGPIAPNFGFYIADSNGRKVHDGETGELYLSGSNVGLGYYNNNEKTQEVFIQNPEITAFKDIVYKTGDLVKYSTKENLLYFCGRIDNQIKRMGYRIELEEIEQALGSLYYIEENAVIFIKMNDEAGKIIACIRTSFQNEKKILDDLAAYLPAYMIPNEIRYFEHLPKNQNGKIDRLQLKEQFTV